MILSISISRLVLAPDFLAPSFWMLMSDLAQILVPACWLVTGFHHWFMVKIPDSLPSALIRVPTPHSCDNTFFAELEQASFSLLLLQSCLCVRSLKLCFDFKYHFPLFHWVIITPGVCATVGLLTSLWHFQLAVLIGASITIAYILVDRTEISTMKSEIRRAAF